MSVSTIFVTIFIIFIVLLFYSQYIVKDFNVDAFDSKLDVLKEYIRVVGNDGRLPPELGFVSEVDDHDYKITYFDTFSLDTTRHIIANDNVKQFDFDRQEFSAPKLSGGVSRHPTDETKFIAHADDGDVVMKCDNGVFDGEECVEIPVCTEPNTTLPLTEDRLNKLVFNKIHSKNTHFKFHPTVYVKCDENAQPHLQECLNGEVFADTKCVYDPTITTNGQGLVTALNVKKIKASSFQLSNKILSLLRYPVNDNTKHNAAMCVEAGVTFIDDTMSDNQYIECLGDQQMFLHTCVNRLDGFTCDKEDACLVFDNGSGNIFNTIGNDNLIYDTGVSKCSDYVITDITQCDTTNMLTLDGIATDLEVPRQVFDGEKCVDFSLDHVRIDNDNFKVQIENDHDIDFSQSMVGRVSKLDAFFKDNSLNNLVTYSKDIGEIGINYKNMASLDCQDQEYVVDIFDNSKYRDCSDDSEHAMRDDQYYDFISRRLIVKEGYRGECRSLTGNYCDAAFREVDGVKCFFTMPLFNEEVLKIKYNKK
uniref:ORF82 protein n=1 Tax=Plutella xylostella granulovirus TaxID=98383 RepID=A0A7U3UIU9_9BBAC|nr:ORF82 protein [Plutella xylostella granulovirus]